MNIIEAMLMIIGAIAVIPVIIGFILLVLFGIAYVIGILLALTEVAIKDFVDWLNKEKK